MSNTPEGEAECFTMNGQIYPSNIWVKLSVCVCVCVHVCERNQSKLMRTNGTEPFVLLPEQDS